MGPHLIILGMVVAQLADAISFVAAVTRFGISHEANGIAAALYRAGGLDAVLLTKGAAILAILLILVVAHRSRRVLVMGGAVATSLGLLGFITNTWSIAILSG